LQLQQLTNLLLCQRGVGQIDQLCTTRQGQRFLLDQVSGCFQALMARLQSINLLPQRGVRHETPIRGIHHLSLLTVGLVIMGKVTAISEFNITQN
jgi:hypothetical protein